MWEWDEKDIEHFFNKDSKEYLVKDLKSTSEACRELIDDDEFDETTFAKYFRLARLEYEVDIAYSQKYNKPPEIEYDTYETEEYAEYYNEHTKTNNYYDKYGRLSTCTKGSALSYDDKKTIFGLLEVIAGIIILMFLLRGCAHGEKADIKKELSRMKRIPIEFQDKNFTTYEISEEVIKPLVRTIK